MHIICKRNGGGFRIINKCLQNYHYQLRPNFHQTSTSFLPSLQECYKILGVTPTSTPEEIKAAYIERCKRYHPDRHQGNLEMQHRFVEVKEAYQKLSAPRPSPGNVTTGYKHTGEGAPDFHAFYPKWKTKPKSKGPEFNPFWNSADKDRRYANDASYYKKEYYAEENTTGTRNLYKLFGAFVVIQVVCSFVYGYFFKGTASFTFHDDLDKSKFPQRFVVAQTSFRDKLEPTRRVDFINRDPRLKKQEEEKPPVDMSKES